MSLRDNLHSKSSQARDTIMEQNEQRKRHGEGKK